MKTLLAIKIHSVIDVITNSSSELFVCEKTNTLDTVKAILKEKQINGIEEPWVFSLREYRNWRTLQQYAEIKDWESNFGVIEGWFYDPASEQDIKELRQSHIRKYDSPWADRLRRASGTAKGWEQHEVELEKIYQELEYAETKPLWWNNFNHDYRDSVLGLDGCVIIVSEGDNTIDSEDMDWIEDTFNARRTYMG